MENLNFKPILPKTWIVESILVTLLCCLPFGIAGIVYASQVESKFNAGDYTGARNSSKEAGKWTMIGFGIGIVAAVLTLGFSIIITILGISSEFFN